jgi:hypothetical protein
LISKPVIVIWSFDPLSSILILANSSDTFCQCQLFLDWLNEEEWVVKQSVSSSKIIFFHMKLNLLEIKVVVFLGITYLNLIFGKCQL